MLYNPSRHPNTIKSAFLYNLSIILLSLTISCPALAWQTTINEFHDGDLFGMASYGWILMLMR